MPRARLTCARVLLVLCIDILENAFGFGAVGVERIIRILRIATFTLLEKSPQVESMIDDHILRVRCRPNCICYKNFAATTLRQISIIRHATFVFLPLPPHEVDSSSTGFGVIFFLDMVKDHWEKTGGHSSHADAEAIKEMMVCVSVVIGFAWEHAFMIGLKAVDQDLSKNGAGPDWGGLDVIGMILSVGGRGKSCLGSQLYCVLLH